ncbi:MAG TPA: GNAT family N-acetyltransferase [Gaiellales bacterium]|nr:GNAT family N-acetyltransferase [Gaiellales bacterium]
MRKRGVRDVILREGSTMRLSQPTLEDRDAIMALIQRLSPTSLYHRYRGFPVLDERLFAGYLDADGQARGALIGVRGGLVVAMGTYDRLRDPATAEVAFMVDDPLHGRGVGTRLLEQLAEMAAAVGIRRFVAEVSADNERMLEVFKDAGFEISRQIDYATVEVMFPIAATDTFQERVDQRDHRATVASLEHLLHPRCIAVFGASARPDSIGNAVVRNLVDAGFPGAVYPLNRQGDPVAGIPGLRSATQLPASVDLGVICVPAEHVVRIADEALRAGVRALCVISAGFAESGPAGRARQDELLEHVRMHGARLLGPNCLGVAVPAAHLNATFASHAFPEGSIGFSSQSGAIGLALLDRLAERGLGLSAFVSVGNKADISTNDLLEYWADDEATRLALVYVESFGNPRKFSRVARRIARNKPVLAMKSGTGTAGARAAGSHTAAIAGSDAAVDALFREAGVLRVQTLGEVLDLASLLASHPLPAGNRVGVATNAGGLGILCADACERAGLELPAISEEIRADLAAVLPAESALTNPVDMLGSATAAHYRQTLPLLLADTALDAVIAIYAPAAVSDADEVATAIAAAAEGSSKPVLAVVMTGDGSPAAFARPGSPVAAFLYPESASATLGRAAERAAWLRRPVGVVHRPDRDRVDLGPVAAGGRWLDPVETRSLLEGYGLPLASQQTAASPRKAARAAREMGFPVAVKSAEPGVHKTERGAVVLGLRTQRDVAAAASAIGGPVLVQAMVCGGVELLAGFVQDPSFGPVIAFGPGGVHAELIGEATVRIAPITDIDAIELITTGKAGRLVSGYRGAPAADRAALTDLLTRLSMLAEEHPEVAELDLNPIIARSDGCVVVDARARIAPPAAATRVKTW